MFVLCRRLSSIGGPAILFVRTCRGRTQLSCRRGGIVLHSFFKIFGEKDNLRFGGQKLILGILSSVPIAICRIDSLLLSCVRE